MADHDAERDALAAHLEAVGYLVVVQRPDGAWTTG